MSTRRLYIKAEFDAALADFNSRLTTFEAGINSKIDSQVTSYLDRNGIWNGREQTIEAEVKKYGNAWGYNLCRLMSHPTSNQVLRVLQGSSLKTYSVAADNLYVLDQSYYRKRKNIVPRASKSGLLVVQFTVTCWCNQHHYDQFDVLWPSNGITGSDRVSVLGEMSLTDYCIGRWIKGQGFADVTDLQNSVDDGSRWSSNVHLKDFTNNDGDNWNGLTIGTTSADERSWLQAGLGINWVGNGSIAYGQTLASLSTGGVPLVRPLDGEDQGSGGAFYYGGIISPLSFPSTVLVNSFFVSSGDPVDLELFMYVGGRNYNQFYIVGVNGAAYPVPPYAASTIGVATQIDSIKVY